MKLYYYCKSCQKKNAISVKSTNRYDLKMEFNDTEFSRNCDHCGSHNKRHINRLHAEANKMRILIVFGITVILTVLIWNLGYISKVVLLAPIAYGSIEQGRASKFNKVLI